MTHICVGKLTIIDSDNGLSPGRRQAFIWTNDGILLIRPLGTNFSEILIEIQTFSLKKIRLKMSSAKCCSFRLSLNVLTHTVNIHICASLESIIDGKPAVDVSQLLVYGTYFSYIMHQRIPTTRALEQSPDISYFIIRLVEAGGCIAVLVMTMVSPIQSRWRCHGLPPNQRYMRRRPVSALVQLMACCMFGTGHHLSQCWYTVDWIPVNVTCSEILVNVCDYPSPCISYTTHKPLCENYDEIETYLW